MHRGYGFFRYGGIFTFIVLIAIAYFLIKYVNQNKNKKINIEKDNKAIEILRERYASGEISEEEYTAKLSKLKE